MKKAVPPTTPTASRPTISTRETMTAMTVFFVRASIYFLLHQAPGFVGIQLVIIAFAEGDRCLEFGFGGGLISGLEPDSSELEMRPALDPFPPFERNRLFQIRFGVHRAAGPRAGGPALQRPDRVLAEHPRPRVGREQRRSFLEHPNGLGGFSGPDV